MAAPEGRDGGRGSIRKLAELLAKLSWFQAKGRGGGSRWPFLRPNREQMFVASEHIQNSADDEACLIAITPSNNASQQWRRLAQKKKKSTSEVWGRG